MTQSIGDASSRETTKTSGSSSVSSVSVAVPKLSTAEPAKCVSPVVPSVEVQRVDASLSSQTDKLGASGDKAVSQVKLLGDTQTSVSGDSGLVSCSSLPLQPTSLSTSISQMPSSSVVSASSPTFSGSSFSGSGSTQSAQPTVQDRLKRVEDIPAFAESGSTSDQPQYEDLADFVKLHPYVLKDLPSPEYTFDVQDTLKSALYWMDDNDTSELVGLSRAYLKSHRICDAQVLCCLERFCDEHPEILTSNRYEDGMTWSGRIQYKLHSLLHEVRDGELRKQEIWVRAKKFLATVPWLD